MQPDGAINTHTHTHTHTHIVTHSRTQRHTLNQLRLRLTGSLLNQSSRTTHVCITQLCRPHSPHTPSYYFALSLFINPSTMSQCPTFASADVTAANSDHSDDLSLDWLMELEDLTEPAARCPDKLMDLDVVSVMSPQTASSSSSLGDADSDDLTQEYLVLERAVATLLRARPTASSSLTAPITTSSELAPAPSASPSYGWPNTSSFIPPYTANTSAVVEHGEQIQSSPRVTFSPTMTWAPNFTESSTSFASSASPMLASAPYSFHPPPLLSPSAAIITSSVPLSDSFKVFAFVSVMCLTRCTGEPTGRLWKKVRVGRCLKKGVSTSTSCHKCKHDKKTLHEEKDTLIHCRWSNCPFVFCYGCLQKHFGLTLEVCLAAWFLYCPACFDVCPCLDCEKRKWKKIVNQRQKRRRDEASAHGREGTCANLPLSPDLFESLVLRVAAAVRHTLQIQ